MDRQTAQTNLRSGLVTAALALAMLGLTLFAAILYIG